MLVFGISVQFVTSPTVMSISCLQLIMSVVLVYTGTVSIKNALLATQPQPCIWSMVSYLVSLRVYRLVLLVLFAAGHLLSACQLDPAFVHA